MWKKRKLCVMSVWNFGFRFITWACVRITVVTRDIIPITNETLYSLYKCFPSTLAGMFTNARERDKTRNNTENLNSRRKILKYTLPHNNARQVQWNFHHYNLTIAVCTLSITRQNGGNKKCNSPKVFTYLRKKFRLRNVEKF